MDALDGPDWEPALTFPLPPNPDIALLLKARDKVIAFFQWQIDPATQRDYEKTGYEIQRAHDRLREILALVPAAESADFAASIEVVSRVAFTHTESRRLRGFRRIEVRIEIKAWADSVMEGED